MTVRALDSNGDIVTSGIIFLSKAEEVGQTIETRLKLFLGEYFRDITQGTPWFTSILGKNTADDSVAAKNTIIKNIILQTDNVVKLLSYDATFDSANRKYTITSSVLTEYGQIQISTNNNTTNFGVL